MSADRGLSGPGNKIRLAQLVPNQNHHLHSQTVVVYNLEIHTKNYTHVELDNNDWFQDVAAQSLSPLPQFFINVV